MGREKEKAMKRIYPIHDICLYKNKSRERLCTFPLVLCGLGIDSDRQNATQMTCGTCKSQDTVAKRAVPASTHRPPSTADRCENSQMT